MSNIPILSLLIFFPLIGSLIILLINKNDNFYENKVKEIGLWTSILNFLLSLVLLYSFNKTESQFQFVENFKLIDDLGIYYYLGIDGISLSFILLTTLLIPICILASWNKIKENIGYFIICFLLIECFLIGVFSFTYLLYFLSAKYFFVLGVNTIFGQTLFTLILGANSAAIETVKPSIAAFVDAISE